MRRFRRTIKIVEQFLGRVQSSREFWWCLAEKNNSRRRARARSPPASFRSPRSRLSDRKVPTYHAAHRPTNRARARPAMPATRPSAGRRRCRGRMRSSCATARSAGHRHRDSAPATRTAHACPARMTGTGIRTTSAMSAHTDGRSRARLVPASVPYVVPDQSYRLSYSQTYRQPSRPDARTRAAASQGRGRRCCTAFGCTGARR